MRHIFTLMALSMAVLVVDISTASAQWLSRGGRNVTTYSVGGLGLSFGQTSYSQPYYNYGYSGLQSSSYNSQPYYSGLQAASYYTDINGNQYTFPSNVFGQNQTYYTTPSYYGGQSSNFYYPRSQSQYYRGYQQRYRR